MLRILRDCKSSSRFIFKDICSICSAVTHPLLLTPTEILSTPLGCGKEVTDYPPPALDTDVLQGMWPAGPSEESPLIT